MRAARHSCFIPQHQNMSLSAVISYLVSPLKISPWQGKCITLIILINIKVNTPECDAAKPLVLAFMWIKFHSFKFKKTLLDFFYHLILASFPWWLPPHCCRIILLIIGLMMFDSSVKLWEILKYNTKNICKFVLIMCGVFSSSAFVLQREPVVLSLPTWGGFSCTGHLCWPPLEHSDYSGSDSFKATCWN